MSSAGEAKAPPKQRRSPRFAFDALVRLTAFRPEKETSLWGRSTDLCREGIGMRVMTGQLELDEVVGMEGSAALR